jgi:alpha-L-rhamnosidase
VFLPWTSWRRYGDTSVIDEHWSAMERFLASIHTANPDLLWKNGRGNDFGDWLALDAKQPGDPTTPKDLIGTAFWKACADAMVDMAQATGRRGGGRYRTCRAIAQAFAKAYVQSDGGSAMDRRPVPSWPAFRPAACTQRKPAADLLVADIAGAARCFPPAFWARPTASMCWPMPGMPRWSMTCCCARPTVMGLYDRQNATTIWERWNGDTGDLAMNSFNHYALGAVAGFMFRRLAGIDPVEPGFARFRFDPVHDARMPSGGARYQSRSA